LDILAGVFADRDRTAADPAELEDFSVGSIKPLFAQFSIP
jgi:hypothetical protein